MKYKTKWKVEYYFKPNGFMSSSVYEAETKEEAIAEFYKEALERSWGVLDAYKI